MRARAVFFSLLIASLVIGPARAEMQLLHQERSLYRNIFVTQNGDQRCLTFRYPRGVGRQSCKLLHEPQKLIFEYTRMLLSALFLNPDPKRILVIGEVAERSRRRCRNCARMRRSMSSSWTRASIRLRVPISISRRDRRRGSRFRTAASL